MINIDGNSLTINEVIRVARQNESVGLSADGRRQIEASRAVVEKLLDSESPVYGISTGFGDLSRIWIPPAEREKLRSMAVKSTITLDLTPSSSSSVSPW